VHHNNCVLFYVQEAQEEAKKKYRKGSRKELWKKPVADIVNQDVEFKTESVVVYGICRSVSGSRA
jgi:hypothetical protein